jgi:hypothetical protein
MVDIVTTTTNESATTGPWSVQAPYLKSGFERAQQLFATPLQYYPRNTVAPLSQQTRGAINDIIGQSQGNPYLSEAKDYFTQSVGGGFLPMPTLPLRQPTVIPGAALPGMMTPGSSTQDGTYGAAPIRSDQTPSGFMTAPGATSMQAPTTPQMQQMSTTNPYLDAMYQAGTAANTRNFMQKVVPEIGAQFGMSGRSGSPGMMNAIQSAATGYGEGLGNFSATLYGNAYENERKRQQEMAMFAPNLMDAQTASSAAALEAAQLLDEQRQKRLSDEVERFKFNQEEPWKRLERYMGNVTGAFGSDKTATTTAERPVFEPEVWQQILGGITALGGSGAFGEGGWLPGLLDAGLEFGDEAWDWLTGLFPGA